MLNERHHVCNFGVNFQSVTVVCHQGVISKAKLSTEHNLLVSQVLALST